ncbi:MAG: hypothetical protein ABEJ59_05885 [Halanaeroarchaeum sp.]
MPTGSEETGQHDDEVWTQDDVVESLAKRAQNQVDPEAFLSEAGAVEACRDGTDLCLTESFEGEWLAAAATLREDAARRREQAAALFDLEGEPAFEEDDMLLVLTEDGRRISTWVSEGALVADLAADAVLRDSETGWADVWVDQRPRLLRGLRAFYERCPLCGGDLAVSDDTLLSCRQSWEVYVVRCTACHEHLLEIDPPQVEGTGTQTTERPVDGGFTR